MDATSPKSPHEAMPDQAMPEQDDQTVVVDRTAARLASAKRKGPNEDDEDDRTVAVARGPRSKADSPKSASPKPKTARKRIIVPPPISSGFVPQPIKGPGADATERYRPRLPSPPGPAPATLEARAATREQSARMPSVARHARITARVAVAAFVVSCVASVAGLTLIAFALVGRH